MPEETGTPSAPTPLTFDTAGAAAAIDNAGGLSTLIDQETQGLSGPSQLPTPGTPSATETTPPASTVPDTFTQADLNSLLNGIEDPAARSAVETAYKSFQGDYTRKTQEVAQMRQSYEQFGSPQQIQEAIELHRTLADPSTWPALYQELSQGLQALGMTPAQAQKTIDESAPATTGDPFANLEDPELAPFKEAFTGLRSELDTVKGELAQRQKQEQQQQVEMMLVGEMQRQESVIRQSRPDYNDNDINAVYELSSYYDGNLLAAQQRYEAIMKDRFDRWVADKQTNAPPVPPSGGATTTTTPTGDFKTLDEAHVAAMEAIRQIEAQPQ